ncbi:MAG: type II secretion system protein [Xanthomonadaceae bacterium]|nr:type II secretion system protein [Xanthomonadaceae bacterium]
MSRAARRKPSARNPLKTRGFTLLEAIVALVIFSLGAFSLYGWMDVNLRTLGRIEAGREALSSGQSALDLLRRVNPMEEPTGRREVAGLVVEWRAEPLLEPTDGMSQVGRPTLYEIGLYRMDVQVWLDRRPVQAFSVRQVGWRQVRFLELD